MNCSKRNSRKRTVRLQLAAPDTSHTGLPSVLTQSSAPLPAPFLLLLSPSPPAPAVTKAMDSAGRLQAASTLLVHLLSAYAAASGPFVIVLDDAIFMDKLSWALVARIVASIDSLLVVLLTRPINKSNLAAFTAIPPEYGALTAEKKTVQHVLQARPPELIYSLACQSVGSVTSALVLFLSPLFRLPRAHLCSAGLFPLFPPCPSPQNVKEIPDSFARLAADKAGGNPLAIRELVTSLKKDGHITLSVTGAVQLGPALTVPKPSLTVPVIMTCILGCRLDKLTVVQQMILKTAAIIGDEFSYDFVASAYPLAVDAQKKDATLAVEFQALVQLGYVKRLNSKQDAKEVLYTFTSGFMRDMVSTRLPSTAAHRQTEHHHRHLSLCALCTDCLCLCLCVALRVRCVRCVCACCAAAVSYA
jgi:hypothetical protein